MIRETKIVTLKEMASVCSQLVNARDYFARQANYYFLLFNKHCVPDPNSKLPNSPLVELFQRLAEENSVQYFRANKRIEELQGIADSTMFADLDY